jgi:hypothetical protein
MARRSALAAVPRIITPAPAPFVRLPASFHEDRLENSPLYRRRERESAATRQFAQEQADCYVNHRRPSTIR